MGKKVLVVLAEGFEEIEAVTPVDVLRRCGAEVTVAGLSGMRVKSSRGLSIHADVLLDHATEEGYDLLVLPGGMPGSANLGASAAVRELAVSMAKAGKLVAAICAAPAKTLAKFGLLDGKSATCYPGFENEFPASARHSAERVVVDGNIITSKGPGTAMEFALALAKAMFGPEAVEKCAAGMQVK